MSKLMVKLLIIENWSFNLVQFFDRRQQLIVELLGSFIDTTPFIHLGIPIFNGKSKVSYNKVLLTKLNIHLLIRRFILFSL